MLCGFDSDAAKEQKHNMLNRKLAATLVLLLLFAASNSVLARPSSDITNRAWYPMNNAIDLPSEWLSCEQSDDCTAQRNPSSCLSVAVNKKFATEAAQRIPDQPDGTVRALDQTVRCVNNIEAFCEQQICKLKPPQPESPAPPLPLPDKH